MTRTMLLFGFLLLQLPATAASESILSDQPALMRLQLEKAAPARSEIIAEADKALEVNPGSVMDKTGVPPSGDKHDYYSMAPYYWPKPGEPQAPHVFRDGQINPEYYTETYDVKRWTRMCGCIESLAQGWVMTGNARYAKKAAHVLQVWFVDPATRMNPNLTYSQLVQGVAPTGGVIETRDLPRLVDNLVLLESSPDMSAPLKTAMKQWMGQYLTWMTTNKLGVQEGERGNNRGTSYDAQVAAVALYVGKKDFAKEALDRATKRLQKQVAPDGSQPRELTRTKSLHYSVANVAGFIVCARLGEAAGVDLWSEPALHKAIDYLAPYSNPAKKWPHPELKAGAATLQLGNMLAYASLGLKQPELMKQAMQAGWDEKSAAFRLAFYQLAY